MKEKKKFKFDIKTDRPEELYKHARDYFKGGILESYATSKSLMRIQERITKRALELLNLRGQNLLILGAGCGPGFASIYLKEMGYNIVAIDIIEEFLIYYDLRELNPLVSDMCLMPFKPNVFDGIISISALQWIYKELNDNSMLVKLENLAENIYMILKPKAKAVFQFYPKNSLIMKGIGKVFSDISDFKGNFIIDNPESAKKRKIFLLISKN